MPRLCLALDLVDDARLIAEYEDWHRPGRTPPDIVRSIRDAGIVEMEIYRCGDRMFMLIDAADDFSQEHKARSDAANPHVQAWAALMRRFQRPVPSAGADASWIEAARIFRLTEHGDRAGA